MINRTTSQKRVTDVSGLQPYARFFQGKLPRKDFCFA